MTCSAQLLLNVDTVFKLYLSGARFDFLILAAAEHCVYITAGLFTITNSDLLIYLLTFNYTDLNIRYILI